MFAEYCTTQFGIFKISASEKKLLSVVRVPTGGLSNPNKITNAVAHNLIAYSKKEILEFKNVEVPLGTAFQMAVWNAITHVPYGTTKTYASIACEIGHPKAVRAVGTAVGKNPLCILIPCHRIVKSDGTNGNYAYGPKMKQMLLQHETKK